MGTAEYRAFKSGIPAQIVDALGTLPNLTVIDREEVIKMTIREHELYLAGVTDKQSAVELGKLLNARYMVAGDFMVMGRTMRINAKVIEVETAEIVQQSSINGPVDDFFILQKKVAVKLADGLNVKLNPGTVKRMLDSYDTKSLGAFIANYEGEQRMEQYRLYATIDRDRELAAAIKKQQEEEGRILREIDRQRELARREKAEKRAEITRLEQQLKKQKDRGRREIEHLRKMKPDEELPARKKDEAKRLFEKAIKYDMEYKRARENLTRLAQAIPMTL